MIIGTLMMAIRHTSNIAFLCFVQSFMSQSAAIVMSRRSVNLTPIYSFANLTKLATSTLDT